MTDLRRLAIALTSATLGVPPDGLGVDAVAVHARALTASLAAWRRDRRAISMRDRTAAMLKHFRREVEP